MAKAYLGDQGQGMPQKSHHIADLTQEIYWGGVWGAKGSLGVGMGKKRQIRSWVGDVKGGTDHEQGMCLNVETEACCVIDEGGC